MVVSFEGYKRDFSWKLTLLFNMSKLSLLGGFLENLGPLYHSKMAKVSIVYRSQKWIIIARSVISGIPKIIFKSAIFNVIL